MKNGGPEKKQKIKIRKARSCIFIHFARKNAHKNKLTFSHPVPRPYSATRTKVSTFYQPLLIGYNIWFVTIK